ncbi:mRNA 3'-end-processing protein rna14 [Tilletia horrida]|uniref:mRNA 3'-end-processing protein RNA14 n=1 Tax=Tilletia horrida TaxID=155126 RepID=A0AAN6GIY8_9BASI|nr:mRNA 3'-end-processing protein rna14 [Tilletia horrida]
MPDEVAAQANSGGDAAQATAQQEAAAPAPPASAPDTAPSASASEPAPVTAPDAAVASAGAGGDAAGSGQETQQPVAQPAAEAAAPQEEMHGGAAPPASEPAPAPVSANGNPGTVDVEMKTIPPPAPAASEAPAALPAVAAPSSSSQAPSRHLSGEELYRAHLAEEPRDPETWLKLLDAVLTRGNLDEIRKVYDDFFQIFPTAEKQWVAYLDLELAHSNFAQVESLFARCLRNTPSMELWRFYLSYTRRVNPLPPITGGTDAAEETPREKTRRTIEAAYEFCLSYIGREKDSGNIWMEYIHFIKEREVRAVYKEGQKMDDLRRVYHRALAIPLNNIEIIWRDYDQWESSLNKVTAKKFLGDRSAAYMTARSALRELHSLVDHLHRPALPRLPAWFATHLPNAAYYDVDRDRDLAEDWKKYLSWEAKNPLRIDEPATLQARVIGAYKRAMMTMRFYPEIWYSASSYCASVGRSDEAVEWLRDGMKACPGSFLLSFAFVDLQEGRKQTSECSSVLDALLQVVHSKIDNRLADVAAQCAAIDAEGTAARAALLEAKRKTGAVEDLAGEERELERQQEEKRTERKRVIEAEARPETDELKESAALIWIKHMQFLRRTEGIRSTRALFGKARKSPYCTWQVWEANALIEYHCSKDKNVATKVFELALKTFGEDEAFVTRYLEFLITINDDSNARALLERVIPTFPPERARPIWDRWAEYEYAFGDLESIQKMESRLAETYPDEPAIKRFLDRNTYMDLDVISVRDMGYQPLLPGANAAERAVAATRDLGDEQHLQHGDGKVGGRRARGAVGGGGNGYGAELDELGSGAPSLKRPRLGRDSASPAPGAGGGLGPAGDRRVSAGLKGKGKRDDSPGVQDQRAGIVERPTTFQVPIPEPVLFFMDILPRVDLFDGPRLNEHDMIDCILSMNVPLPPPTAPAAMSGGARGGIRGRKRGGFGRRF